MSNTQYAQYCEVDITNKNDTDEEYIAYSHTLYVMYPSFSYKQAVSQAILSSE